jgi:hypothetical protein
MGFNGMEWDYNPLNIYIYSWLVVGTPTPLKNHGVQVTWDDEIPT